MNRNRLRRVVLVTLWVTPAFVALGLVAAYSCASTQFHADGGFPPAELHIHVVDGQGQAIREAVLHVYRSGSRQATSEYPIYEAEPTSDEQGRLTCHQIHTGFQWGGRGCYLFWCIRTGPTAPQYDCEITAAGYRPLRFDIWRLFESPHHFYEDLPKSTFRVEGREVELPVYEHEFTLQAQTP
jgi:hypothetical protein